MPKQSPCFLLITSINSQRMKTDISMENKNCLFKQHNRIEINILMQNIAFPMTWGQFPLNNNDNNVLIDMLSGQLFWLKWQLIISSNNRKKNRRLRQTNNNKQDSEPSKKKHTISITMEEIRKKGNIAKKDVRNECTKTSSMQQVNTHEKKTYNNNTNHAFCLE